ncbi:hypothetical protein KEM48_001428 [Puccinia striiformis f. sp. tritici PST-130]|nr:hypothetical protein KEM48_001428 [Puccinia striiformis f. sp. tritici PST-130]
MPYSESTLPSDEDEDITHTLFEKETTIKKAEQSHDLSSQAEEDEEAAEDDITLPNQAKIINSSISESNILKHPRRALLAAHKQTKILLNSAKNLATRALLTALALVVVTPNNHNQAMKSHTDLDSHTSKRSACHLMNDIIHNSNSTDRRSKPNSAPPLELLLDNQPSRTNDENRVPSQNSLPKSLSKRITKSNLIDRIALPSRDLNLAV